MKKLTSILKNSCWIFGLTPVAFLVGCIDPNTSSYPSSYPNSYGNSYGNGNGNSYGNGYGSGGGYHGGYGDPYDRERHDLDHERRESERERRDIENERQRVEQERERLEEKRAREYSRPTAPPPQQRQQRQETCPSGYSPSEQKCSPDERRHGCKDVRLNSGLGCVHR